VEHELSTNRALWDELVEIHAASTFYDVAAFRAGQSTLRPLELEEVGDVRGKRLLHLQCHFGLDTLSWARLGAEVTGVDFSEEAVSLARRLAEEVGVPATFVCADVLDLPCHLSGAFDVVFTSYGALTWLPDLGRWGAAAASSLDRGGILYVVDQHPLGGVLAERDGELVTDWPYFADAPAVETSQGSYADRTAVLANTTSYQWQHTLSGVVNALTGAGLHIEFLHEFPFSMYQRLPSMVEGADGWWRLPGRDDMPFLFSLRATKE